MLSTHREQIDRFCQNDSARFVRMEGVVSRKRLKTLERVKRSAPKFLFDFSML